MTAKVLTHFLDKCRYESSTGRFYVENGIDGFHNATDSAELGNDGSDPEGVQFNIKVVEDRAYEGDSTVWEEMNASYHDASGDIYFERQSTVTSSTGAAIEFTEVLESEDNILTMYGVTGVQHFLLLKELAASVKPAYHEGVNYVDVSQGLGLFGQVCDNILITPRNDDVELHLDGGVDYKISSPSATTLIRATYKIEYINSSGAAVVIDSKQDGFGTSSSATLEAYGYVGFTEKLTQAMLNPSGVWELVISVNTVSSSNTAQTNEVKFKANQIGASI